MIFKLLYVFVNRKTWMVVVCSIHVVNYLVVLRQSMQWYMYVDMQKTIIAGLLKREPLDGPMKSAFHTL